MATGTHLKRITEVDRTNARSLIAYIPASAGYYVITTAGTGSAAKSDFCSGTDPATEAGVTITVGHTGGVVDIGIPIVLSMGASNETADAAKNEVTRGAVIASVGIRNRVVTTALTACTPTFQLVSTASGAAAGTAVAFTGTIDTATKANPTLETLTITNGVTLTAATTLLLRLHLTQDAGAVTTFRLYETKVTYTLLI